MGKKSGEAKTGTQPKGNQTGIQSSNLAPANPKGLSTARPGTIIAEGKGHKSTDK